MLFEQPGGQFGGESQDALFALVEGDELFLLVIVEEEVEGGVGVGEPLLPQLFTTRRGSGCVLVHGGVRKGGSGDCFPPDRIPAGSERNYRTAPRVHLRSDAVRIVGLGGGHPRLDRAVVAWSNTVPLCRLR